MASTTVSLILNTQGNAAGIRQITQSLKEQQNQIKQLQSAERARSAAARAAAAQQRALNAQQEANASKTVASQMRASQAFESARAATARADIAQRQHALLLARTGSEAQKTGSALQRIGAVTATAGSAATSAFRGLLSTLTSVAATAGKAGLALAAVGGAGLASGLRSAALRETDAVLAAGNIARVAGTNAAGGRSILNQLTASLNAKSGGLIDVSVSREFANTFVDDVIGSFGKGAKAIDLTAEIANQLAAFSTLGGADKGQLKDVVIDFVSGALTNATLDNRDILNNTGLTKIIKDELEKSGKQLQDLNPAERIQLLSTALKKGLSPDTLQELASTAQGQFAILKNRLFGEQGLFSVTRDLLPSVEGEQTVFEQFKNSLRLLFNSDGLFGQLARILNASGINLDIMAAIRSGWLRFNNFLVQVNQFLSGVRNLGDLIGRFRIDQINWQGIGAGLAQKINEFLKSIDFGALGRQFGQILGAGLNAVRGLIVGFVTTLDWGSLVKKLGNFLIQALLGIRQSQIEAFRNLFSPLTQSGPFDSLPRINSSAIIADVSSAFQTFSQGVQLAAQWLTNTGSQILERISVPLQQGLQALYSGFSAINFTISSAVNSAATTVSGTWISIQSTIARWCTTVQAAITTAVTAIQSVVSSTWNAIAAIVAAQFASLQALVQGAIDRIIATITAVWDSIRSKLDALQSAASSLPDLGGILSNAFGAAESALNNFLARAREFITGGGGGNDNRPVNAAASGGNHISTSLTVGELHIHAAPGESVDQLADKVLAALDARLRQRVFASA